MLLREFFFVVLIACTFYFPHTKLQWTHGKQIPIALKFAYQNRINFSKMGVYPILHFIFECLAEGLSPLKGDILVIVGGWGLALHCQCYRGMNDISHFNSLIPEFYIMAVYTYVRGIMKVLFHNISGVYCQEK